MPGGRAVAGHDGALPDPELVARVAWLERFYDLVFVACVGRFANKLGVTQHLPHALSVLVWPIGLWVAWLLVTLRLNRFPDEGWLTRVIVIAQLLAMTIAAAAALSITLADNRAGVVATAALCLCVSALYLTIPRRAVARRGLVGVPVVGSVVVSAVVLLSLVLPRATAAALGTVVVLAFLAAVFGWFLPQLARHRPVDPRRAGDRYCQLFLILMGLSFLKVAFATNARYGVEYLVVAVAFAAGIALWSIYVDGVLPLGFPVPSARQRTWILAQLVLSVGVTVAAAAVTALPPSTTARVTVTGAVLEGGSFAAVMGGFAVLAVTAQRPQPRLAYARCGAALTIAAVTVAAVVTGTLNDRTLSGVLAALVIAAALADGLLRPRPPDDQLPGPRASRQARTRGG
jgi:low temperature requirement protein LtrA